MIWLFAIAYLAIGVWVARHYIIGTKLEDQETLAKWERETKVLELKYRTEVAEYSESRRNLTRYLYGPYPTTPRYPEKPKVHSETQLQIMALLTVPTWVILVLVIALVKGPAFIGKLILWKLPPTPYELNKRIAELEEWHREHDH